MDTTLTTQHTLCRTDCSISQCRSVFLYLLLDILILNYPPNRYNCWYIHSIIYYFHRMLSSYHLRHLDITILISFVQDSAFDAAILMFNSLNYFFWFFFSLNNLVFEMIQRNKILFFTSFLSNRMVFVESRT